DAVGEVHAGGEVGDRDADPPEAAAGRAGDAHQPAHALGDLIDAGLVGDRALLTEAGDTGQDDALVDAAQRLVVEAEPVLDVLAVVLDHHVGVLDQPVEDRAAGLGLQVDRDRALVAVEVLAVAVREVAVDPGAGFGRPDD